MSSAVVSTSAALRRHFIFDDESELKVSSNRLEPAYSHVETAAFGSLPRVESSPVERSSPAGARIVQSISNKKSTISLAPASRLEIRPAPEMASTGIDELDALTGGLPRGCLTEICGPASSGRTTVLLAALAAATRRGEFCALIDASDALDPHSAAATNVDLDRLLWVRCSETPPQKSLSSQRRRVTEKKISEEPLSNFQPPRSVILSAAKNPLQVGAGSGLSRNFHPCPAGSDLSGKTNRRFSQQNSNNRIQSGALQSETRLEQVLRATDLLLESGGFGLIALDLADLPVEAARRIPLTTWFRFRRAIEHTPTMLLVIEHQPIAGSCSSLLLQLNSTKGSREQPNWGKREIHPQQDTSHEAAICESPARQCRVAPKKMNESRRDDTKLPAHAHLLTGLEINMELIRSRLDRKPARSVSFATQTAWAG